MAITHTWQILRLSQLNNGTETVCRVRFRVTSVEGEHEVVTEEIVHLDVENIQNFIPYSELNEEIVLSWVKSKLSQQSRDPEANNVAAIDTIKNPPAPRIIQSELPWTVNAPEPEPTPVVEEPAPEPTPVVEEPVVE